MTNTRKESLTALRDEIAGNGRGEWDTTPELLETWAQHHKEQRQNTTAMLLREYASILSALIAMEDGE